MKNFKRIVSIVCAIAMILTVCVVSASANTTVAITMNNNGTITTENLTPGEAMPALPANSLGEPFCGWYTDCVNWDAEDLVLTVPETDTTVYARYPSTVIEFKQITSDTMAANTLTSSGATATVANNVLALSARQHEGIKIPAYDAADVNAYKFTVGATYDITFALNTWTGFSNSQIKIRPSKADVNASDSGNTIGYPYEQSYQNWRNNTVYSYLHAKNGNSGVADLDASYSNVLITAVDLSGTDYSINVTKIIIKDSSVTVPENMPVAVTMNNNGTITTTGLIPGSAMPNPGVNELGESFLGWYTDNVNWTESSKVTTVPEEATTVYARYPSVIINFTNDMTAGMANATYMNTWNKTISVTDGALNFSPYSNAHGFTIPAYDMTTFTPFVMNRTSTYTVKFYIKGTIAAGATSPLHMRVFYVKTENPYSAIHGNNWNGRVSVKVNNSTDFVEYTAELPANAAVSDVWYDSLVLATGQDLGNTTTSGQSNNYVIAVDKIVITDNNPELPAGTVTMNNNGTITTQTLTPGDAMPNPGANELGESFLGWYTDCQNWTGKVETVPTEVTTVYARYPSVIIDFNNLKSSAYTSGTNVTSYLALSDGDGTLISRRDSGWIANYSGLIAPAYDGDWTADEFKGYKLKPSTSYKVTVTYQSNSTNNESYIGLYSVNAGAIERVAVDVTYRVAYIEYYGNTMQTKSAEFTTGESVNTNLLLNQNRETCTYTFDKIIITDNSLVSEEPELPVLPEYVSADYDTGTITITPPVGKITTGIYVGGNLVDVDADANPNVVTVEGLANTSTIDATFADDPFIGWASIREKTAEVSTGIRFRARVADATATAATEAGFLVIPTSLIGAESTAAADLVLNSANDMVLKVPVAGVYADVADYTDYQLCVTKLLPAERGLDSGKDFTTQEFSVVFYVTTGSTTTYSAVKTGTFSALA